MLARAFSGIEGVDSAYIYGSWASRYSGVPGPIPADVDVLIVGLADQDALDQIARDAEVTLGREVNVRRIRPETWAKTGGSDAFLTAVRSSPLVTLDLTGGDE